MLAALHILLGVITPHLGAVITGFFALLKARQDVKPQGLKEDEKLKEKELDERAQESKDDVAKDRIEHANPTLADKLTPIIKLAVVVCVLGLFAYGELTDANWEDDWRQGLVSFVLAHTLSRGVKKYYRLKGN